MENFSFLISSFIMIISSIIFAFILLEPKEFKFTWKKLLFILFGIAMYDIVATNFDGTIKTLILFCLYINLFKYMFKITYYDSLILSFLYIVTIIIPDILVLLFAIIVLKINPEVFYTTFAETALSTLIVNIILLIITLIFKKILQRLIKPKLNKIKGIIIYIILTLSCVLIVFYNATANIKVISKNLLISIIIMIAFVVILYSLIKQKIENNKIVEKYDKLLEFIKKYEVEIDEQKSIRHESKNQLLTIKAKILNQGEHEEIIEYIDSILSDYKTYDEEKYGKFQYLPANGLKGLFYYKAMEAEEKGIKLSINVSSKVEKSILKDLSIEDFKQLGRLVGVYLDNAIEASSTSKNKKMGIEIYKHKSDVIIIIMNTYDGIIDTELVGKVKYSTKGKNRGYGLMLVNKILNGNRRFSAERTITKELYIQKLTIKKSI